MKMYFVTGNENKYQEILNYIPGLQQLSIFDLPEIQHLDINEIIKYKLMTAKPLVQHEDSIIIVEDTGLYLKALNDFPGPLIKFLLKSINNNGIYDLCNKYGKYDASATTVFGLYDSKSDRLNYFSSTITGRICAPIGNSGFGWDQIFVPLGATQSYAQMKDLQEKNKYSMRYNALQKIVEYIFNKKSLGT